MKITVYCSSSDEIHEKYHNLAEMLGEEIGIAGDTLVYGGTLMGLMGTIATSVKKSGGNTIGIVTRNIAKMQGVVLDDVGLEFVETLEQRKSRFMSLADVHVVLPGGFGTLDEAFSVLASVQTKECKSSVIFVNYQGYFDGLKKMFGRLYEDGFAPNSFCNNYHFCQDIIELVVLLKSFRKNKSE